jgi:hypothetical protein
MNRKSSWLLGLAVAGVATFGASGCMDSAKGDGGTAGADPDPPAGTDDKTMVPTSAGASGAAFVTYVKSLPTDEVTTEPNTFAAGFTDPAEDGDEPFPAS